MKGSIDHDKVSGLLNLYARDLLGPEETEQVRNHLDGCDDCTREYAAVQALLGGSIEPLSELERTSLHRAVERAAARAAPVVSLRPGLRERFGSLAAVAAVLMVVGGGLAYVATRSPEGGGEGAATEEATNEDAGGGVADAQTASRAVVPPGAPQPVFVTSDESMTLRDLDALPARSPFVDFASTYSTGDAIVLGSQFLDKLAEDAPDPPGAETVRRCAAEVMSGREGTLPAYGRYGRVAGTQALLIGFVWNRQGQGRLNRYMLWQWPDGSCEQPPSYRAGPIRSAP